MITDAVVPVAGLGTRLLPATRAVPKEMLPVVDRPVVQYVIEELAAAGVERVLLVTSGRKRALEDHFGLDELDEVEPRAGRPRAAHQDGLQLLYTRQARPRGLGDAVGHAEGFAAPGQAIVVALGDAIITAPPEGTPGIVSRLAAAYLQSGASATVAVTEVPANEVDRYGIVIPAAAGADVIEVAGGEVIEVAGLVEKPPPGTVASRLAIAARYVLGPEVFAALRTTVADSGGEVQLTAAIAQVISDGGRVVAVPLAPGERRHDIGTVEGYCAAFLEHALRHPTLGAPLRARAAALLNGSG